MNDLSPALLSDLQFAVSRHGLRIDDIPRDHQGKTITDRLAMLHSEGESYCHSEFRKTDLRAEHASVWDLFPENPDTLRDQARLMDEVGHLLEEERSYRLPPRTSIIRGSELPTPAHLDTLRQLLSYLDGTAEMPSVEQSVWADVELFDEAAVAAPELRAAEVASITREQLVTELTSGAVPAATAMFVRRALDSDMDGLRNADITLAGCRVRVGRIRDAAERALEELTPHVTLAERVRALRVDLETIDRALHWPGTWQTAPASLHT